MFSMLTHLFFASDLFAYSVNGTLSLCEHHIGSCATSAKKKTLLFLKKSSSANLGKTLTLIQFYLKKKLF
jgi:hypothetical protein